MTDTQATDATVIDADGEEIDAAPEVDAPPTTAALVPVGVPISPIVRPVTSLATVREAFADYEAIKKAIVVASDMQAIGNKLFVKKSGWRKMAVAMGVSGELQSRDYERDAQGRIIRAEAIVRAIAPNGRTMDGLGVCDFRERCCPRAYDDAAVCKNGAKGHTHCTTECDGFNHFSKPQHDIPATAFTRALNRACSDLFGFGEVSAEEVTNRDEPAEESEWAPILTGLNSIEDKAQRTGAKMAFANQFGQPSELLKGQLEAARRFVTNSGGTISDPAAAEGASPTDASTHSAQTSDPGESSGSAAGGEGGEHVGHVPGTPPPANNSGADSVHPDAPDAEPTSVPPPPVRRAEAAPSGKLRPSTAGQRQQIGMKVNALAQNGLLKQGDKPEIVSTLTVGKATSTTEMFYDQANKMVSTLAFIESGDLVMADDGEGGRAIHAATQRGHDFLVPIVEALAAAPARDDAPVDDERPRESEIM